MRNPFVSGNPCFVAQTVVCAIGLPRNFSFREQRPYFLSILTDASK
jgi:hypothetical protein